MDWWWSFVSRTDHSSDSILCTVTEVVVSTFLPRGLAKSEQKCWVMETLLGAVSEWGVPGIDTGCFGDTGSAGSENVENFKVKRGSFLFFKVIWTKIVNVEFESSPVLVLATIFLSVFHFLGNFWSSWNSVEAIKKNLLGSPGVPVVQTLCFQCRGLWVPSLVGEPRSHTPWGTAKNKIKNREELVKLLAPKGN